MAAAFDPGCIVIGGGVSAAGELLLEPTRQAFSRTPHRPRPPAGAADPGGRARAATPASSAPRTWPARRPGARGACVAATVTASRSPSGAGSAPSSRRSSERVRRPGAGLRSSTRRSPHDRETQIIMQSLRGAPPSLSTESRWSGSPSSTRVSQVPQVPSAQEESTPTPASSTTDMIERSGGTVRVSSLRCRTTSNASCAPAPPAASARTAPGAGRRAASAASAAPPPRAAAPGRSSR